MKIGPPSPPSFSFLRRYVSCHSQESSLVPPLPTDVVGLGINAFLYMTLGRMIHFFLPGQKLVGVSARRFGVLFVCLDIFAFIVQATGAIMTSFQDGGTIVVTGLHIYMGGIGLQEAFILCFTALAIYLHRKLLKIESSEEVFNERLSRGSLSWRWLFYVLYFALGMITVS
jgi:hypothetical protein